MTRWVFDGVALPDSYCHLTWQDEIGPRLFGREFAKARLDELARAGVGVVRDVRGDRSITLKLAAHQEVGWPVVLRSRLAAATTAAQDFLGVSVAEDLVTYDEDPRERPEVLASPAAVVLRGQRIR